MIGDSIRIGRLRMQCRAPLASNVGVSARIQDALRTSSKPSAWFGRVVLVRHLRIRVHEPAPAYQMTVAIEREWQRLARSAVEYSHASPASEAVWFASQIDARLALIARLASGADTSAWFWQRVLPVEAGASRDRQLLAVFAAPWVGLRVSDEEQMRFAQQAFAALGSTTRASRIVAALGETELRRLLPTLSYAMESSPERRQATSPIAEESLRAQAVRMAVEATEGHHLAQPGHHLARHKPAGVGTAADPVVLSPTTLASGEGFKSQWAGLFFLLNLLDRVADPPSTPGETVAILRAVATWLRIEPGESIHEVLAALNDDESWADVPPATIRALRLACLAMTRRPLRRIVGRAGRVVATRTHLTIIFDLNSVRLDVRKAGLDIDPGWLPRLGRVVRFEYE